MGHFVYKYVYRVVVWQTWHKRKRITIQYDEHEPSAYKYRIAFEGGSGYYVTSIGHCVGWLVGQKIINSYEAETIEEQIKLTIKEKTNNGNKKI